MPLRKPQHEPVAAGFTLERMSEGIVDQGCGRVQAEVRRRHNVTVLHPRDRHDLRPESQIEKAERMLNVTPRLDDALAAGFAWYQAQSRRTMDYTFEDRLLATAA